MTDKREAGIFQTNEEQYTMPDALKQPKKDSYKVGYEATTGNHTDPDHEFGKR